MRFIKLYQRYMLRPIVYQSSTRLAFSLAIALLLREFAATPLPWSLIALAAVFLLLSWVAWLRLDGARLPALDHRLFRARKRKDPFAGGAMADYLDEKPISFEELTNEERDACLLVSNLIAAIILGTAGALL
ncbi:MAG: hypothetical protein IJ074_08955 [Clostridia bacterium]|nr:hypothetical protein [Clostridia bacterium]